MAQKRSMSILSRKNRRNSAAKATIEASLRVAAEYATLVQQLREREHERERETPSKPAGAK